MTFTTEQIELVDDHTQWPDPGADRHYWAVHLGPDRRVGWVYVAGSVPPPSDEWIAQELTRLSVELGKALESRLLGTGGLHLARAPRDEED